MSDRPRKLKPRPGRWCVETAKNVYLYIVNVNQHGEVGMAYRPGQPIAVSVSSEDFAIFFAVESTRRPLCASCQGPLIDLKYAPLPSWDTERPLCTRCNNAEKQVELGRSITQFAREIAEKLSSKKAAPS